MPFPKLSPAAMRAFLEEAGQMYKGKFTPGFVHASPSNKIKVFDPTKTPGDPDLITPGASFFTRDTDFGHGFLPIKKVGENGMPDQYETGATMYPVSLNLGKHFHPLEEEGKKLIQDYAGNTPLAKQMAEGDWSMLESPDFMNFLKKNGYDSMTVFEGGVPNVAVFDPKNIRGKFAKYDPLEANSPEFMKAKGGPVQHFADAGAVKKVLEFAKSVPFLHYSHNPNLSRLEPSLYGTGIKGAESARLAEAPDIKPRSFFYTQGTNVRPESGLGPHQYSGVSETSYPLHEDPAGFSAIAKAQSKDPYLASVGIDQINQDQYLNNLERSIKNAGYSGYHTKDTGLVFNPTTVTKTVD